MKRTWSNGRWIDNLLAGFAIGSIAVPILAIVYDAARAVAEESIAPETATAVVGGAAGVAIGVARTGVAGLVGTAAAAIAAAAAPLAAIAFTSGAAPGLDLYASFGRALVPGALSLGVGQLIGTGSSRRFIVRGHRLVALGLFLLTLWSAFWFAWAIALAPRTVRGG